MLCPLCPSHGWLELDPVQDFCFLTNKDVKCKLMQIAFPRSATRNPDLMWSGRIWCSWISNPLVAMWWKRVDILEACAVIVVPKEGRQRALQPSRSGSQGFIEMQEFLFELSSLTWESDPDWQSQWEPCPKELCDEMASNVGETLNVNGCSNNLQVIGCDTSEHTVPRSVAFHHDFWQACWG